MQTHSANHSGADNELPDKLNQSIGEAVVTGWEAERRILFEAEKLRRMETQNAIENAQVGCDFSVGAVDIVAGIADVATIIDNAPTDPEELERYIEAQRAAQNAGLLIGAAVAAIELLSEKLEEMKADAEDIDMDIS